MSFNRKELKSFPREKKRALKVNPNVKELSKQGYRDDSPYRTLSSIDVHTPNGNIDMSATGIPILANGRYLPPYSGIHHFDEDVVHEIPLAKEVGWLDKYQDGGGIKKIYTELDEYNKAKQAQSDSSDAYNYGLKSVEGFNAAIRKGKAQGTPLQYTGPKSIGAAWPRTNILPYETRFAAPQGIYTDNDREEDLDLWTAYYTKFKKPVIEPVYQPNNQVRNTQRTVVPPKPVTTKMSSLSPNLDIKNTQNVIDDGRNETINHLGTIKYRNEFIKEYGEPAWNRATNKRQMGGESNWLDKYQTGGDKSGEAPTARTKYNVNNFILSKEEIEQNKQVFDYRKIECSEGTGGCLGTANKYYNKYIAPVLGAPSSWDQLEEAGFASGRPESPDNPLGETLDAWETYKHVDAGGKVLFNALKEKDTDLSRLKLTIGSIVGMGDRGTDRNKGKETYNLKKGVGDSNHSGMVIGYTEDGEAYVFDSVYGYNKISDLKDKEYKITNIIAPKSTLNNTFENVKELSGNDYTPLKLDYSKFEYDKDFDKDEFVPFVKNLESNKYFWSNLLGTNDKEYDELARQATALTISETEGGNDNIWRPWHGIPVPAYLADKMGVTSSVGMTQINKENIKNLWSNPSIAKKLNGAGLFKTFAEAQRSTRTNMAIKGFKREELDMFNPKHAAFVTMLLLKDNESVKNRNAKREGNVELTDAERSHYQWHRPKALATGKAEKESLALKKFTNAYERLELKQQGGDIKLGNANVIIGSEDDTFSETIDIDRVFGFPPFSPTTPYIHNDDYEDNYNKLEHLDTPQKLRRHIDIKNFINDPNKIGKTDPKVTPEIPYYFQTGGAKRESTNVSSFIPPENLEILDAGKYTVLEEDKYIKDYSKYLKNKYNVTIDSTSLGAYLTEAYYNPFDQTINYNPHRENKEREEFQKLIQEIPHKIQADSLGTLPFIARIAKEKLLEKGKKQVYKDPSTLEYEAHSVIAHKLADDYGASMWDKPTDQQIQEKFFPKKQTGGALSHQDSLSHQANKILQYEQLRGGPGGVALPGYGDPKYMDMLMNDILPEVNKIMPNASAMEKGEAMDYVFNAGWDIPNKKITKDPRGYALQEYYRKYDPSKLDKNGMWSGRKGAPYSFDEEYNNTIGKLSENDRRVLMNKGRDWYYQNTNVKPDGSPSDNYDATWYGRIWNTNDFEEFNPNNPKFTPKKQQGGPITTPGYVPVGMYPKYTNPDGTVSNEVSMGMNIDGREMLLPSFWEGSRHDANDVEDRYRKTGEHLGVFNSVEDADRGAQLREYMNNEVLPYKKSGGWLQKYQTGGFIPTARDNTYPNNEINQAYQQFVGAGNIVPLDLIPQQKENIWSELPLNHPIRTTPSNTKGTVRATPEKTTKEYASQFNDILINPVANTLAAFESLKTGEDPRIVAEKYGNNVLDDALQFFNPAAWVGNVVDQTPLETTINASLSALPFGKQIGKQIGRGLTNVPKQPSLVGKPWTPTSLKVSYRDKLPSEFLINENSPEFLNSQYKFMKKISKDVTHPGNKELRGTKADDWLREMADWPIQEQLMMNTPQGIKYIDPIYDPTYFKQIPLKGRYVGEGLIKNKRGGSVNWLEKYQ